jgi:phage shock protein E
MFKFLRSLFGKNNETIQQVLAKGAVIVDVRTPAEFKQGHLKGAKNVPLNEIKLKADLVRGWGKPVITVCRSGSRSLAAKGILRSLNIESYNGGAWTSFQNKYSL